MPSFTRVKLTGSKAFLPDGAEMIGRATSSQVLSEQNQERIEPVFDEKHAIVTTSAATLERDPRKEQFGLTNYGKCTILAVDE